MPKTAQGTDYEAYGDRTNPPVILIHGLGLTRATWDGFIPALSEHYYIITYDLDGHGNSDISPETASLTRLAKQLACLMDEIGLSAAHLVGFSLGGMINRRFAMDYPDRVLSLVILNSPHERDSALQARVEAQAKASADGGTAAVLDAALIRWFTDSFRAQHTAKLEQVRQTLLANDPENYAQHRYVLAAGVTELIRPQPALDFPALIITCENDTGSTPEMTKAIHSEIKGSEFIVIPALQHLGLIEEPALFIAPIQDFLGKGA